LDGNVYNVRRIHFFIDYKIIDEFPMKWFKFLYSKKNKRVADICVADVNKYKTTLYVHNTIQRYDIIGIV
jgi:hypothetical protein